MRGDGFCFRLAVAACICIAGLPAYGIVLKPETAAAFDRYIAASERRMDAEISTGPFLFTDALAPAARSQADRDLRAGQVVIQQVNARAEGHPTQVPGGLIHDWEGVVFIPNASLDQVLRVVEDYDDYHIIYAPEMRRSSLLSREGDRFGVSLQFYQRALVLSGALNGEFDIRYQPAGPGREICRAYATRLVEVDNVGRADEREVADNAGHGILWRLDTYWRFEQRDGGVYVQVESIGLSRSVPAVVAWFINPLLRSIPRGALEGLLKATRKAVLEPATQNSGSYGSSPDGV